MCSPQNIEREQHVGDRNHVVARGGVTVIGGRDNLNYIVFPQDADRLLQSLPGWDLERVRFDESKACFRGTREKLLHDILQWVQSPDRKRILWVSGGAGTGKSSVAHSCAVALDRSGCLGASFFFNRDIPKLNTPNYLMSHLCYQLAHFDPILKERILCAIESMGHIPAWSLRSQARKLIVETTAEANLGKLVVLVVDAVDEAGAISVREFLLYSIAEEFPDLPDCVKVIVTSRDEPDIRAGLEDCSDEIKIENAEKTEDDIASYIHRRFAVIRNRSRLPLEWPPQEKLEELYRRAGRLFIWASVACNFVDSGYNRTRRLNELLNPTSDQQGTTQRLSTLCALYNRIFESVFPIEEGRPADYHYVVGSVTVLQTPLTRIELDSLLGFESNSNEEGLVLPDEQVTYLSSSCEIINPLRSVLREDTTDGSIRPLHPSLYDFLTTHADDHLRINIAEQHQTLAIRCLQVMNSQLKFDICDIRDAYSPNIDISEKTTRISPGLRYSCRAFVYHIANVLDPNTVLISALTEFTHEHILHWVEAMSLLQAITKAEQCLQGLARWMKGLPRIDERTEMIVCDTIELLRNCGSSVRLSALHTYYSALALTPKSRELYKCWFGKIERIPNVICSHPIWPAGSVRVLEGHISSVTHVVFSRDGQKLASASFDSTLRLWDVESGQPIGNPFEGHTSTIQHIAFSPDGTKLASASWDKTLRVWDVESGMPIGGALTGHTHSVNHVVFSPDGKTLASASNDNTLRLWDVDSGQPIGALEGHTHFVTNVVFSSDGKRLASASHDKTLRLWDVENCKPIGDALTGHLHFVNHVVFSPDGKTLASASHDKTLRLWDVESGKPIGDPLNGHTDFVNHVIFSPDGKTIASASDDSTLRLWDVKNRRPIGDPLTGHTYVVTHVVFSPNGMTLASASGDKTLRLWDVESGNPIGDAFNGHTDFVNRVIFSHDGKTLASASDDSTLRLWDVESGQAIGDAVNGHTSVVNHVVFSPDGKTLASASGDKTLRLWDVGSGQPIGDALIGHTHSVNHVVFSPDGKKLASASSDETLRLWDVETGHPIGDALIGHTDFVNHVAFSPDGRKLASTSDDKTLRLWDVESGHSIGDALEGHHRSVNRVEFSPDGRTLVSASDDETFLWDVESGTSINPAEDTVSNFTLDVHCPPLSVFDSQGYIQHQSRRLIWLPVPFRGCMAFSSSSVVVGGRSGAVTFIHL